VFLFGSHHSGEYRGRATLLSGIFLARAGLGKYAMLTNSHEHPYQEEEDIF
jgi:hypothetical protein